MIRWAAVIFLALTIFYPLMPWLEKLWVGRMRGDIRFKAGGQVFCLPFGSTVVWSIIAFVIAELAGGF